MKKSIILISLYLYSLNVFSLEASYESLVYNSKDSSNVQNNLRNFKNYKDNGGLALSPTSAYFIKTGIIKSNQEHIHYNTYKFNVLKQRSCIKKAYNSIGSLPFESSISLHKKRKNRYYLQIDIKKLNSSPIESFTCDLKSKAVMRRFHN